MRRGAIAFLVLAVSVRAAAYLPPAPAILRRVAQHRDDLRVASLEVRGNVAFASDAAEQVRAATGISSPAGDLTIPAILLVKAPGRCRLELAVGGAPASQRPAVWERGSRVAGQRGLDGVAAMRALVEGICTLLAGKGGDPERGLGQQLADRGVDLRNVALGRLDGRVAWIVGGRQQDTLPQAWFDKQTFQPVRLIAPVGGATRDVRLLDFSPPGGERFPRIVEVWQAGRLEARFSTEAVTTNPRLPDALF